MKENLLGQPMVDCATKFSTSKDHFHDDDHETRSYADLELQTVVGHEEVVQPVADFDSSSILQVNTIQWYIEAWLEIFSQGNRVPEWTFLSQIESI